MVAWAWPRPRSPAKCEALHEGVALSAADVLTAPKSPGWIRGTLGLLGSFCALGFFVGTWVLAIGMPFALLAAVTVKNWQLAGALAACYVLPHVIPLPSLPFMRSFLFAGIKRWLGPPGTVRFVDLSSMPLAAEPEPEPEPRPGGPRPQLLCMHPHGVYSLGVLVLVENRPDVRILSAPYLYHFAPAFRLAVESFMGVKMGSVGGKDLARLMKKQDSPLMLVPGGFHEATITCPGTERVFLRHRKGFIKYALRYGYDLVPCYTIGENDLMANPQGGWKWRFFLNSLSIPAVLPWGWTFIPLFPRRGVELVTAVGPPVRMPHIAKPTKEDVDEHHARYMDALQRLYTQISPGTKSANRKLEIW